MSASRTFRIAVFAGDGIGPEVIEPTLGLLEHAASRVGDFGLDFMQLNAGANNYARTGVAIPDEALDKARAADAILLGAMGMPDIRYPNGTEISPQLELREKLHLYAGVRPIRAVPGLPVPFFDKAVDPVDIVLVRESTEGLFKSRNRCELVDDEIARDTLEITRATSERLFDFCFRLGRRRKEDGHRGNVTCVDKANVLGSFAFFRKIFDERAAKFPDVGADHCYVDACALRLVTRPNQFDVLVTENMFGDILSDLGAGLIGGIGMAPSADIGIEHAVFQPCHGSAPDIVGTGTANPVATFLSAAMMLEWLAAAHAHDGCRRTARLLRCAVDSAFETGNLIPCELGGSAGTAAITRAVTEACDTSLST